MTTKIPVELSSTPGIADSSNATAITIDSSENCTFAGTVNSLTLSSGGVTGPDSSNFTLNTANSFRLNIDSNDSGTGESFIVGHNQTAINQSNVLFKVQEDGSAGVGTSDFTSNFTPEVHFQLGTAGTGTRTHLQLQTGTSGYPAIHFGDGSAAAAYRGFLSYSHPNDAMTFGTTASERMRIDSSGNVMVAKTTVNSATVGCELRADGRLFATASGSYSAYFNRTSSDGSLVIYAKDDVTVGSISTNANSLPSDRNFKKDIVDLNIGLDLVTKLKPVSYNYKIDDDDCPKMFGLIAQDLEQSLEEVGVDKNSVQLLQHKPNEDEKESDYALDYLKLTPILIKAIQEQQEQIEQLKTEIQTLKGE